MKACVRVRVRVRVTVTVRLRVRVREAPGEGLRVEEIDAAIVPSDATLRRGAAE